jgi:hypothetical protein
MVAMPSRHRTPPQGGLPPDPDPGHGVVHIACDESGFSGTNVLDPTTPVFTHASVDLDVVEAAALVAELRAGLRWSRTELKSGPLLRGPQAAQARTRLLSALHDAGAARAHVVLVDKELFLATRVVDLVLGEPSYAAGTPLSQDARPAARDLRRAGRAHPAPWSAFLEAFVALVRTKRRTSSDDLLVERLLTARDLLRAAVEGPASSALGGLTEPRVRRLLARLADGDPDVPPALEPLVPALAGTVLHWSHGRRQVLVTHDEQSALTAPRLRRLQAVLPHVSGGPGNLPVPVLAGLVSVDSRDDPRVQVADLLAGVARRTADPAGEQLLAPFLSGSSLWDPAS